MPFTKSTLLECFSYLTDRSLCGCDAFSTPPPPGFPPLVTSGLPRARAPERRDVARRAAPAGPERRVRDRGSALAAAARPRHRGTVPHRVEVTLHIRMASLNKDEPRPTCDGGCGPTTLVVELGTSGGGSAAFYSHVMSQYDPAARLLTMDPADAAATSSPLKARRRARRSSNGWRGRARAPPPLPPLPALRVGVAVALLGGRRLTRSVIVAAAGASRALPSDAPLHGGRAAGRPTSHASCGRRLHHRHGTTARRGSTARTAATAPRYHREE